MVLKREGESWGPGNPTSTKCCLSDPETDATLNILDEDNKEEDIVVAMRSRPMGNICEMRK